MAPVGYTTLDYVRRALRSADLPGDVSQDNRIAVDAVTSQTEPLEKSLSRHWYEPEGIDEAAAVSIPTGPKTRNDEHDIQTRGGLVHGASERDRHRRRENSDALLEAGPKHERRRRDRDDKKQKIRIARGEQHALEPPVDKSVAAYTRITLNRRDVDAVNELLVVNSEGGYDDWVVSDEYSGGVGMRHRGEDYWVRINNGGVSELYLDVHAMDDDLVSLSNAVYVEFDYGHEGIPENVRRAVAFRAAADLTERPSFSIPDNSQVYGAESKAEELREQADELLKVYT
ncbi:MULTISPECIES: hypothetical protein [Halobacterium]|uniref:hypothetical protein n=1 Tax=Halobacterium TaxID=2239 RepID=UPI001963D94E|nr:hypothetical protein [Halobacterium sp. BOL4-2]QRY26363.1 hypothetical protein JRZ79_13010 [Halobacterium sp. BOL4-2]